MKGAIAYKVTITAILEEEETIGNKWDIVDEKLIEGSDKLKSVYGYTPITIATVRKEVEIFQQKMETLDVSRLILAINAPSNASAQGREASPAAQS